jgi:hypothetical protein
MYKPPFGGSFPPSFGYSPTKHVGFGSPVHTNAGAFGSNRISAAQVRSGSRAPFAQLGPPFPRHRQHAEADAAPSSRVETHAAANEAPASHAETRAAANASGTQSSAGRIQRLTECLTSFPNSRRTGTRFRGQGTISTDLTTGIRKGRFQSFSLFQRMATSRYQFS